MKIFNTSIWVILGVSIVFYAVGFVWYGVLFAEKWMALSGLTPAELANANETLSYVLGYLISLFQAIGLAGVVNLANAKCISSGLKVGALTWVFFALPLAGYNFVYALSPFVLFMIDALHLLIGYLLMGALYGIARSKANQ